MRSSVAAGLAILAVLAAIGGGLAFSRIARAPAPTPRRVSVTATPAVTPSPAPFDEAALFRQPLSAGCATSQSVWIITNGGGLLRYDGSAWEQVDDTLRSLTAVGCTPAAAVAVGLVGAMVTIDERTRQIRSQDISLNDLFGVSPVGDGALMVGSDGAVYILAGGETQPYARGLDEHLRDVVAFSLTSAWAVGADGITYRLDQRGWNPVGSGQTATLRAVAAATAAAPVAVGDAGTIVTYAGGGWHTVKSGVTATLRDLIVEPAVWIAGDGGTLLRGSLDELRPVDLHTSCDLVSIFSGPTRGDVWVVGVRGGGGGVWALAADGSVIKHWGGC
ncbi:MAG TPA: hypothetical protein VFV20_00390 [Candidatus Limnocylindria bacterium]|nr:hypothetical protein [Candidatus Limnocylindria bacterium]